MNPSENMGAPEAKPGIEAPTPEQTLRQLRTAIDNGEPASGDTLAQIAGLEAQVRTELAASRGLDFWTRASRQEFVTLRAALQLIKAARAEDAVAIVAMFDDLAYGNQLPDTFTLDKVLDKMMTGPLLRLPNAVIEISNRNSLKVLAEEILVHEEYYFESARPAPRVIDCGVNFGLTLAYVKSLYPQAQIIGFEPHPQMHALASRNIERNGWQDISLHKEALSAAEGTATFYLADLDTMGASLTTRLKETGQPVTPVDVRTVRLSDYLQEPTEFLKMDIEGAEYDVLSECEAQLGNVQTLFCEYHSRPAENEETLTALLGVLNRAGFSYHIARSPWVERKYALRPGNAVMNGYSLSIFARNRN